MGVSVGVRLGLGVAYEERAVIEQIAEAAEEAYEMVAVDVQQEELIVGGDDEDEDEDDDGLENNEDDFDVDDDDDDSF